MKILALTDYQADYLAHSVLTGLYECGHDIWEMPVLNSVRGGTDEGYDLPDGNRGMTATPSYLRNNPLPAYIKPELSPEIINSCDLIVMLSGRDYARRAFGLIHKITGKSVGSLPIVLCEGEDYEQIDRDLLNLVQPKVFFKRELSDMYRLAAYSGAYGLPIFPLPFAAFTRSIRDFRLGINDQDKQFDFFISLGDTHILRRSLIDSLLDARALNFKFKELTTWIACNSEQGSIKSRTDPMLPWEGYIQKQAQARMTAVVRGYGSDTLHCWEAFSHETAVVYYKPQIHIPYPFTSKHCIMAKENEVGDIPEVVVDHILHSSTYLAELAKEGTKHCLFYHSTKARAAYLVDVAMRVIGGDKVEYGEFNLI